MKVELNIDPSLLDLDINELFKTLTEEQIKDIALQVTKDYLTQPFEIQIRAKEKEEIDRIRRNASSYLKSQYETDDGVRASYEYIRWKSEYKDSRTLLLKEINQAAAQAQKEAIKQLITDNEQIQNAIKEQVEIFKKNIPNLVQQAMVGMFTKHLAEMSYNVETLMSQQAQAINDIASINDRLLTRV